RRRLLLRNALWCAWLRRPLGSAVRVTARMIRTHLRDPDLLPALVGAVAGSAWVAAHRRVVPVEVEKGLRALAGARDAIRRRGHAQPAARTPTEAAGHRSRVP